MGKQKKYESQIGKQVSEFTTSREVSQELEEVKALSAQNQSQDSPVAPVRAGQEAEDSSPAAVAAASSSQQAVVQAQQLQASVVAQPAPKKRGREKKNGDSKRVSLFIPETVYNKIKEDADKWGGGNISRMINVILGEKYGIKIN